MSAPRPVFIVGAARSGTTLLQQMLDHHPNLAFPWESFFIPVFHKRIKRYGDLADSKNRQRLIEDISEFQRVFYQQSRNHCWCSGLKENAALLAASAPGSYAGIVDAVFRYCLRERSYVRWCDKTPIYVMDMPLLLHLFPEATFLHIVRDGRDVAASILPLPFGPNSIYTAAQKWKTTIERAGQFRADHPDRLFQFRYEDLIAEPETVLRSICAFIGEDFDAGMLSYHSDSLHRVPDSNLHKSVGEPVTGRQIARWKKDLSANRIELYEAIAGDALTNLGYSLSTPRRPLRRRDMILGRSAHYLGTLKQFSSIRELPFRMESLMTRIRFAV